MRLRGAFATVLAFGLAIWPIAASATLLFSGGGQIDFVCAPGGVCGSSTFSGNFRPTWAKESYTVSVGGTVDPPTNRSSSAAFTSTASLWTHAQYCSVQSGVCAGYLGTATNVQMLRLMDSANNPAVIVRGTGVDGAFKISSRSATGTFSDLVTCPSALAPALNSALTQLDLYVNYGMSGEVALYSNSVKVCDFSGNITNGDGATALNRIEFSTPSDRYAGSWSEVIVATTDTRAMARFTANTVGNGNAVAFSGTNICSSIWGSAGVDDTHYGYSSALNALHECTINNAIPPGAYNVLGLTMSARALVGSTGPQHFNFVTRTGGTDYHSGDIGPTNSFSNFANYIQATNPATGAPWALSDLQAAGFNVGEETKP